MPRTAGHRPPRHRPPTSAGATALDQVRWDPPQGYPLALEPMRIADLKQRADAAHFAKPQRIGFFLLLGVETGCTVHSIDGLRVEAVPGCWLLLRPGQVQRFDFRTEWDGWAVVFRADFLPASERRQSSAFDLLSHYLVDLPNRMRPDAQTHALCMQTVARMHADVASPHDAREREALLLYQLCTLLTRLRLSAHRAEQAGAPVASTDDAGMPALALAQARTGQLRALIDAHYREHHPVGWYAQRLGCTPKTLGRATLAAAGIAPKTLLTERLMIEARRLLLHTAASVQSVCDALGYSDPSHFVKAFRGVYGCTPQAFRRDEAARAQHTVSDACGTREPCDP